VRVDLVAERRGTKKMAEVEPVEEHDCSAGGPVSNSGPTVKTIRELEEVLRWWW
jgi:hypothetical protein